MKTLSALLEDRKKLLQMHYAGKDITTVQGLKLARAITIAYTISAKEARVGMDL